VFQGNLDDPDSLMRAIDGVHGKFSVQPYTTNEIQQGAAVIEVAKRLGVGRWFEEEGFHFNIEEVRHEYPVTHTFDRWLEAKLEHDWRCGASGHLDFGPGCWCYGTV
jgi:hypothetical protein